MRGILACGGLAVGLWLVGCGGDDESSGGSAGSGGTGASGGAAGSGATAGGAGSAGVGGGGICDPSPARCDALGGERPFRVSEHSAAYVPERMEMITFGGTNAVPEQCGFPKADYIAETWVFDDPCGKWTQVAAQGPSARGRHMSASGGGAVWVFGGRWRATDSTSGSYTLYDDLWRFDVEARTWSQAAASGTRPSARINGALAWDEKRSKLWLVGGNTSASGATYVPQNDVWSYDPQSDQWQSVAIVGSAPKPRLFHAIVYDGVRDRLVIHGGADETAFGNTAKYLNDLWALDLETLSWTTLHDGLGDAPVGRFWGGLAFDPSSDRYLVFGGHDDQAIGNRNDTWAFDPSASTWQRLFEGDTFNKPANGFCDFPPDFALVDSALPERRNAHSLVWSQACERALIFGGKTDCGAIDDVWQFQAGTWTERVAATEGEVCLRWRDDPSMCSNLCN